LIEMSGEERGQVSIEALVLAGVIILMSMAVFSYYIQIKGSGEALQLLKIEALKKIDSIDEDLTLGKISYAVNGSAITLCLFTNDGSDVWDATEAAAVQDLIQERTGFTDGVVIEQNISPSSCA